MNELDKWFIEYIENNARSIKNPRVRDEWLQSIIDQVNKIRNIDFNAEEEPIKGWIAICNFLNVADKRTAKKKLTQVEVSNKYGGKKRIKKLNVINYNKNNRPFIYKTKYLKALNEAIDSLKT